MIIRSSRLKMFGLVLVAAAAAWVCDYLVGSNYEYVSGRTAGKVTFAFWLFTAISIFAFLGTLFGGKVRAKISPEGLFAPTVSKQVIPWGDLQSISIGKQAVVEVVQFSQIPGSGCAGRVKLSAKAGAAVVKSAGFEGFTISLVTTGVSGEDFMAAVSRNASMQSTRQIAQPVRAAAPSGNRQAASFGRRNVMFGTGG